MTNKSRYKRKFRDISAAHQMSMFLNAYEAKLTANKSYQNYTKVG